MKLDEFEMIRTLGVGSFGRVKLGRWKKDGTLVAVKFMKKHEIVKLKQVDHINGERNLMSQIHHPFIVEMKGSFKDERFVYIVMETITGGELFTHLRRERKFSDEQAKFYASHVAEAFRHIHSLNIIHRDLKPENILLMANGYSKLTDFGFAKVVEPGSRTYTLCGTPEYIAPEVLLNKGHSKPVDWWTLGILIYEMVVGQPPFCDEDPMGIYQRILAGKIFFTKYFDKNCRVLVKKLLTADLSKRYGNLKNGADDIIKVYFFFNGDIADITEMHTAYRNFFRMLEHKWFSSIDWDKMLKYELAAPFKPPMKDETDTSNFEQIPESNELPPVLSGPNDPFNFW